MTRFAFKQKGIVNVLVYTLILLLSLYPLDRLHFTFPAELASGVYVYLLAYWDYKNT